MRITFSEEVYFVNGSKTKVILPFPEVSPLNYLNTNNTKDIVIAKYSTRMTEEQ
ncbi:MAG: hypothetical protein SH857_11265 [Chitinophagales bacterium]|nr:hypothetical protein [Chitinophagales bacterium]